jgi:hypothetical protein
LCLRVDSSRHHQRFCQQLRNPQHTVGHGIGIAAESARQSPKTNSKQYRISNMERNGPGGI